MKDKGAAVSGSILLLAATIRKLVISQWKENLLLSYNKITTFINSFQEKKVQALSCFSFLNVRMCLLFFHSHLILLLDKRSKLNT